LSLLNGLSLHNGQGNALAALCDVALIECQWVTHRQEVSKHAGEYTTVES